MKKLQILIPQYEETDEILKPMLDSIKIQENIDFSDIGVIICNDGSDVKLSKKFLDSYPFEIIYKDCPHEGVSATRNACLKEATADYVEFCDADDMFYTVNALWLILNEIRNSTFDALISAFMEENRNPLTKEVFYQPRGDVQMGGIDQTFVHGKVYRRNYLLAQSIKFDPDLTIHEDSYFTIQAIRLTTPDRVHYCPLPFYLWKWRDESVCRHDPKYILKTYNNMLDSNTKLVKSMRKRNRLQLAQEFVCQMIYDAYMTMNKSEWIDQENQEYRHKTELRFKEYYKEFSYLYEDFPEEGKNQIYAGLKNRFMQEGMFMEEITFKDWIKHILEM